MLKVVSREPRPAYELTKALDRPVLSFAWASERRSLRVIDDMGTEPIVDDQFGNRRADRRQTSACPTGSHGW